MGGAALRGLGLVAAAQGDLARALELLLEAPKVCRRLPDTYLWIEAYGLDALCAVAVEHGVEAAPRWVDELEATAAGSGGCRSFSSTPRCIEPVWENRARSTSPARWPRRSTILRCLRFWRASSSAGLDLRPGRAQRTIPSLQYGARRPTLTNAALAPRTSVPATPSIPGAGFW